MGCHRRAEFQRRSQKHLLQRLSVGGIVSRPSGRIVEEQCLVFLPRILIFRRENPSITSRLPIGIFFLFENDAKRIAFARVGIKIEIVAENLRQAHGQFRGFPSVFHRIEEGIVNTAGYRGNFNFLGNFANPRREAAVFGNDL